MRLDLGNMTEIKTEYDQEELEGTSLDSKSESESRPILDSVPPNSEPFLKFRFRIFLKQSRILIEVPAAMLLYRVYRNII